MHWSNPNQRSTDLFCRFLQTMMWQSDELNIRGWIKHPYVLFCPLAADLYVITKRTTNLYVIIKRTFRIIDKHVVTKREQIFCQKRNVVGRFLNSRVYAMLWVGCWGRFAGWTLWHRVKHYCGSVLGSHVDLELVCKRLRSVRTWGFREKNWTLVILQ